MMCSRKKISPLLIVFLLLLCFSLSACAGSAEEDSSSFAQVSAGALEEEQFTEVIRGRLEASTVLNGYIAPKVCQLQFDTQGRFGEYKVAVGDTVTEGQILAVLDSSDYTERLEELKQQQEELTADYEYQTAYNEKTIEAYTVQMDQGYAQLDQKDKVWEPGEFSAVCMRLGELDRAVKRLELSNVQLADTYRLEYAYLKEQQKQARDLYDRSFLKAPCDGTVIALQDMSETEFTSETMYYAAIAQKDVYYLRCEYIPEFYLNNALEICGIRNGKEYALSYVPYEDSVALVMQNNHETVYTQFELTQPDEDIDYGQIALVKLVSAVRENALLLPELTISADADGSYVYRKTDSGREKVYITRGLSDGIQAEVLSGLEEGDVVYVQK